MKKVKANIITSINQLPFFIQMKLFEYLTVLKTVRGDLMVEGDIPDGSGKAIVLR